MTRSPYLDRIRQAWVHTDDADTQLAATGMSSERFRAIIEGRRHPSSLDLALLATAFRTTVDWLIDRKPQHEPVLAYNRNDPDRIAPPSEVCDACTDWNTGNLVPASFCPEARSKLPEEPRK